MRSYSPVPCRVCGKLFPRTGSRQWRCPNCTSTGLRDEKPPKCECGCGEAVTWSLPKNAWNRFLHNHHSGVVEADYSGRVPWNKGNLTEYQHKCDRCKAVFKNKFVNSRFCSRECFYAHNTGKRSHLWKNGLRTKYAYVMVRGKPRRAHREAMAKLLGRRLKKSEVVHHIDENGLNNDLSNLFLFHCNACHSYHHTSGFPREYIYPILHARKFGDRT